MSSRHNYCPRCGSELTTAIAGDRERGVCTANTCDYIHWDNPVPVVAAIVELEGKVVLARNVAWPPKFFGLVTGFLEKAETPEAGVLREVKEELNLDGRVAAFVGHYPFERMNQIILAYHIVAEPGKIKLNEELAEYKSVAPEDLKPWPMGTGHAVNDWLVSKGYEPEYLDLSRL